MKTTNQQLTARNKAVKQAYYATLKLAKRMLSTIERHELRCTLIRKENPLKQQGLIDEFCNPLLYLRLEADTTGAYCIRYGFEPGKDYEHIAIAFTRFLYRVTDELSANKEFTDAIKLDWYIHNPDDMYAYLEEQNKYHTFELIEYKTNSQRRKHMKAVA